jgi:FkbM family methyltransferase
MIDRIVAKGLILQKSLQAKMIGVKQIPPNYAFLERFHPSDAAIDVGIGNDPDFSKYLINTYNMECFGVDPTHKHIDALRQLESEMPKFHFLSYALGPENGKIKFFESHINVSGSMLERHRNVLNDPTICYDVDMITTEELLSKISKDNIAIMKIDLEGAEYRVVERLEASTLKRIDQLLIEFHHDIVEDYTWHDTKMAIRTIEDIGMKSFVYNGRDCLFYW